MLTTTLAKQDYYLNKHDRITSTPPCITRGITSYIVCPRPAAAVRGVVVDHDCCKWSNSLQPVDWEQLVQISIVVDRDLYYRRYTVPVTGVQKRYGATVRTKKRRKEPETE